MERAPAWLLAALCLACSPSAGSRPPTHEELVTHHLQGDYAEVIAWCPVVLENGDSSPALANWCMFGYPAALRLSLDAQASLTFVRTVCRDVTGQPKGELKFREFFVEEASRWVALPMRMQDRMQEMQRGLDATISDFAEVCAVEPAPIRRQIDTRFKKPRDLR